MKFNWIDFLLQLDAWLHFKDEEILNNAGIIYLALLKIASIAAWYGLLCYLIAH